MSMIGRIWRTVKHSVLLIPEESQTEVAKQSLRWPASEPPRNIAPPPPPTIPPPASVYVAPARSKTGTAERAAEALRMNPAINSTELAAILGVSSSYARRLLRKMRDEASTPPGPVPCGTMPLFPHENVVSI